MAKVLGESGRYVSNEAEKQRRWFILTILVTVCLLGVIEGIIISAYLPLQWLGGWPRSIILVLALIAIIILPKWGIKKAQAIEKKQDNLQRGASGENQVGRVLSLLPDGFCVINDLSTPYGNIDHVVVGSTGIYCLDTKAWRGVVAADGKGELLINGNPTDKTYIRQFVGRMMGVREKVFTLATGLEKDTRFNAIFVFTAARVEAKWGTTGALNCITDDQLYSYIVDKDFGRKMKSEEVKQIAQAFLGLAHMDKEFGNSLNSQ